MARPPTATLVVADVAAPLALGLVAVTPLPGAYYVMLRFAGVVRSATPVWLAQHLHEQAAMAAGVVVVLCTGSVVLTYPACMKMRYRAAARGHWRRREVSAGTSPSPVRRPDSRGRGVTAHEAPSPTV